MLPLWVATSVIYNPVNNPERDAYRAASSLAECAVPLTEESGSTIGSSGLVIAGYEDYRKPAGVMKNDTLRITLETRAAEWKPWGTDGPAIYTHVFATDQEEPRVPGPLIRFTAGAAEADRGLRGLIIVDEPGEIIYPEERFFLLTHWADPDYPATYLPATRFFINGRSWPHTQRLNYAQGDTVRWRVVNFTGRNHPMHLHGFYYNVDAKGNLNADRVCEPEERRLVVTEMLASIETLRMSWVADKPGNWVYHCHFMRHMSWIQTAPINGPPPAVNGETEPGPIDLRAGESYS